MNDHDESPDCPPIGADLVRAIKRDLRHVNSLIRVVSRTDDPNLMHDGFTTLQRAMMNAQRSLSAATGVEPC